MTESYPPTETSERAAETREVFRHLAPGAQPASLHEISDALYKPFLERGTTELKWHVSGCQIDPIPFVQLANGEFRVLNGQPVSPLHADSLGLNELTPLMEPPAVWNSPTQRQLFCRALDQLADETPLAETARGEHTLVWCHHVHGALTAEFGESTIEIPFSLWAARLLRGFDRCPPWHCPQTGIDTYQLAVDDEGTICGRDSIHRCIETGRRYLETKLQSCHVTGQRVHPSVLTQCPVSGRFFLERLGKRCPGCGQTVDPGCLAPSPCQACRQLQKISLAGLEAGDLARLSERHRWLRGVTRLRLATQPNHWLMQFRYLNANWRVLFDQNSLEISQVTRRGGWLGAWQTLDRPRWPEFGS